MATQLTDPDSDDLLEFTHTVEDPDGDTISVSLELDQINGTEQSGADRTPSWLSYTTTASGATPNVVDVAVEIDKTQLGSSGTIYTFEAIADDGFSTVADTFTLEITTAGIDGSKFFSSQDFNVAIQEFSTTNFSFQSTDVTFEGETDISTNSSDPQGVAFKPDGTKMFVTDEGDTTIKSWTLGTAWDLTTLSFNQSVSLTGTSRPKDLSFGDAGSKLYIADRTAADIEQYNLSTAWDISTLSDSGNKINTNLDSVEISPDGTKIFYGDSSPLMGQYPLSTPYDLSSAGSKSEFSITDGGVNEVSGLAFNVDGSRIFGSDESNNPWFAYDLTTKYDITTATNFVELVGSNISGNPSSPNGLAFGVM